MNTQNIKEKLEECQQRSDVFRFVNQLARIENLTCAAEYQQWYYSHQDLLFGNRTYEKGYLKPENISSFNWGSIQNQGNIHPSQLPLAARVQEKIKTRQTVHTNFKTFFRFTDKGIPNEAETTKITIEGLQILTTPRMGIYEIYLNEQTYIPFVKEIVRILNLNKLSQANARYFNSPLTIFDIDFISKFDNFGKKVFGNVGFIFNLIDKFKDFFMYGYKDQATNTNKEHSFSLHLPAFCQGDAKDLLTQKIQGNWVADLGVDILHSEKSFEQHFKAGKEIFDGDLKILNVGMIKELEKIYYEQKVSNFENYVKEPNGNFVRVKGFEEWSLFPTKEHLPVNTISRLLGVGERFVKIETPVRSGKTTMVIHELSEFNKDPSSKPYKKVLYMVRNLKSLNEVDAKLNEKKVNYTRLVSNRDFEGFGNASTAADFKKSEGSRILLMTHAMFKQHFTYFSTYINDPKSLIIVDETHFGVEQSRNYSLFWLYEDYKNLENLASTFLLSGSSVANDPDDEKIIQKCFLKFKTNILTEKNIEVTHFKTKSFKDFANHCLATKETGTEIDICLGGSKNEIYKAWDEVQRAHMDKNVTYAWAQDSKDDNAMFPSIAESIEAGSDFNFTTPVCAGFSLRGKDEEETTFKNRMENRVVRIGIIPTKHNNQEHINNIMQLIGRFQPRWGIKIHLYLIELPGSNPFPIQKLAKELYSRFDEFTVSSMEYQKPDKPLKKIFLKLDKDEAVNIYEHFMKEESEGGKAICQISMYFEDGVYDFAKFLTPAEQDRIQTLENAKTAIRKAFKAFRKDKNPAHINNMKETLNKEFVGVFNLGQFKYPESKCIETVDTVLEKELGNKIEALKIFLNAQEGTVKYKNTESLPKSIKTSLRKPHRLVVNSLYWRMIEEGAFKTQGTTKILKTENPLIGAPSIKYLKEYKNIPIAQKMVWKNVNGKRVGNFEPMQHIVEYFEFESQKFVKGKTSTKGKRCNSKTIERRTQQQYFKENCMGMKPDDAITEMQKKFPDETFTKNKLKGWKYRFQAKQV